MDLKGPLLLTLALLLSPALACGEEPADPDWPCVQRLVPRISTPQVWPGPEPDPAIWREDTDVARLAAQLAARRTPLEDTDKLVEAFAEAQPKEALNVKLAALMGRSIEIINRDRASIIAGIKRFARHQRALADRISETRARLQGTSGGHSAADADLQELLTWDLRIYDERHKSMIYLCEQPVVLEQRAFALGRTIYFYVED